MGEFEQPVEAKVSAEFQASLSRMDSAYSNLRAEGQSAEEALKTLEAKKAELEGAV